MAVEFASDDWNLTPAGPWQMGKFTKALVLLSPELTAHRPEAHEAPGRRERPQQISVLLLFGKDGPKAKDANRVYNLLEPFHPLPADAENEKKEQSLFYLPLDTRLQGTKLLGGQGLDVPVADRAVHHPPPRRRSPTPRSNKRTSGRAAEGSLREGTAELGDEIGGCPLPSATVTPCRSVRLAGGAAGGDRRPGGDLQFDADGQDLRVAEHVAVGREDRRGGVLRAQ